jgi:arylsulfatase A-like enzyme
VVLVVLDTARASAFEAYADGVRTPTFARLARDGALFRHAITPSPWTLPSHVSLFSGLYPSEHGIVGEAWGARELPDAGPFIERNGDRWLPVAAKRAGYETFGAVANLWVGRRVGFHAGFDRFVTRRGDVPDGPDSGAATRRRVHVPRAIARTRRRVSTQIALHRGDRDSGARRLITDFASWYQSRDRGVPFFAFFNFMEAHAPYVPPRSFQGLAGGDRVRAGRLAARLHHSPDLMLPYNLRQIDLGDRDLAILRKLYEGEVAYADDAVGRLLEPMERSGDLDHTVVVVTADHGENVGEHHLLAHNMSLHETVLHVPLVLRGPGVDRGYREETISLIGLHATLLELFSGIPHPASLLSDGVLPARSEYESARYQVRAFAALLEAGAVDEDAVPALARQKGVAAFRGGFKAIATGDRVDVFDLSVDPDEAAPLSDALAVDARLAADEASVALDALERGSGRVQERVDLDEEIRAHLEALGYL